MAIKSTLVAAVAASLVTVLVDHLTLAPYRATARAQENSENGAGDGSSQIAATNGTVYVLKNGMLYVYVWDGPMTHDLIKDGGTLKLLCATPVGATGHAGLPIAPTAPVPVVAPAGK